MQEAWSVAAPLLERRYAASAHWPAGDVHAVASGRALVGDTDAVTAELERLREAGVNYLVAQLALPGLSEERFRASLTLFARGVAPRMRMVGFPEDIRVRTLAEASDPMIGYLKEAGVT